ncbi:MAG: guanylate kinase [Lachnospiraceae bacterium]|nr:guanylate kinase [Lachnospiraceae bacterium]MBO7599780.1 guanylate kinase [Lachnospiraceae bacterium]
MDGILIVMSGFSGAGKGTLLHRLLDDYEDFAFSVSMTTRAPREGEVDGRDYFFVDKEKFEETIRNGGLYEHAQYCGNYYGTPKAYVDEQLKKGKSVILDIEVQGAMQIKEKFPDTLMVFVTPPSIAVLRKRLEGRGTETAEVINKRIDRAKEEVNWMDKYEYIIINDDLDTAVKEMHDIILAQRYQTKRLGTFIDEIKTELKNI